MIKKDRSKRLIGFSILIQMLVFSMIFPVQARESEEAVGKIAIVDESVEDYQLLVDALSNEMEVYTIKSNSDPVKEIENILKEYNNLEGLHIYSKGIAGNFKLGKEYINLETISKYEDSMKKWGHSISSKGDILFYACNLAADEEGKALIDQIANYTSRDVAGSTNYTGLAGLDSDWDLEYTRGKIGKSNRLKDFDQYGYGGRLDGTQRTWDGEGDDNFWDTAKNWSGDVVPDAYDIVIFSGEADENGQKNKSVSGNSSNIAMSTLKITDQYKGQLNMGSGQVEITKELDMAGGNYYGWYLKVGKESNIAIAETNISGGEIRIVSNMTTYGNVDVTGGKLDIGTLEIHGDNISASGIEDLDDGTKGFLGNSTYLYKGATDETTINGTFNVRDIRFNDVNHKYQVNAAISFEKLWGSYGNFYNYADLYLNDGASIDIKKSPNSSNQGTITKTGTGTLLADTQDFYFCDEDLNPIVETTTGGSIYVTLKDFNGNMDRTVKDTVTVRIKRESDETDFLTINLIETSNDSSVFTTSSAITVVFGETDQSKRELSYANNENLIAECIDSNVVAEAVTTKMDRDPIVWDGEGSNNLWTTALNWSTDTVPQLYDIVLFDDTSIKDVSQKGECKVSQIIIDDGYTGEVKIEYESSYTLDVYNNLIVKSGILDINKRFNIYGNIDIQGGQVNIVQKQYELSSANKDIQVSGGIFYLKGRGIKIKGDLAITGGEFSSELDTNTNYAPVLYTEKDVTLSGGDIDIYNISQEKQGDITIGNVDSLIIGELFINENTNIDGMLQVKSLKLKESKELELKGELTCLESFENYGKMDVLNSSVLDLRGVTTYSNTLIDDNESGKVLYNAGGMGFVNSLGIPIGSAEIGDYIFVELIDLSVNQDKDRKEKVSVTISSKVTGDEQDLILEETGNDTSIFRALVGIEIASESGVGKLKYNGTEDIVASYKDVRDDLDTLVCSLYKEAVIWDGEGEDNLWVTGKNWSTDKVPTRYDRIKLNDTSVKDVHFESNVEMYSIIIEESYTGDLSGESDAKFYVTEDMRIDGGTLDILGKFEVDGNMTMNSGKLEIAYSDVSDHHLIKGDLVILDGEVFFKNGYFDIEGNMDVRGGSFTGINKANWWEYVYINVSGKVNLMTASDIYVMTMLGNELACSTEFENTFTTLAMKSETTAKIIGKLSVDSFVNYGPDVSISGQDTVVTINKGGSLSNNNLLTITDKALLDINIYNSVNNYGTITESNEGVFHSDVKDMIFTNNTGTRILSAKVGDEIFAKLEDGNLNKDGSIKETVEVMVTSMETGDTESIILTETRDSSGIFTNSIGLELVGGVADASKSQLTYNGIEDIQINYIDVTDAEDIFLCKLYRDPLIWDGGADQKYWFREDNWSEDRLPDEFDTVVFNGSSDKDVEIWSASVYRIIIEDTYKGTVQLSNGTLFVTDEVKILGGTFKTKSSTNVDFGKLTISNGTVDMDGYNAIVKEKLEISGGKSIDIYGINLQGEYDISSETPIQIENLTVSGEKMKSTNDNFVVSQLYIRTDGLVAMEGIFGFSGTYSGIDISSSATVNLDGEIHFKEETRNGLVNNGVLNIGENSILNCKEANKFENDGTITLADTGKIYYDASAMGVTDADGNPAFNDFAFGKDMIISLIDKNRNLDKALKEKIEINLVNWTNGDEEVYIAEETGINTNEFRGQKISTAIYDGSTKYADIFDGEDGDSFQIIYKDPMSGNIEYVVSKNCAELSIEDLDELVVNGLLVGTGDISQDKIVYALTIQNTGDIPLEIIGISIDDTTNFSLAEDVDLSDIPGDGSRDITIEFKALTPGVKTANVTIKTGDNDEGVLVIPLKGVGVEAPTTAGIEDFTVLQGTEETVISLHELVNDNQDQDEDLVYEIRSNSNSYLVKTVIVEDKTGILTVGYNTQANGSATIELRIIDQSGAYVDDQFEVSVKEVYTISGTVKEEDDTLIEGASVTIIDYNDLTSFLTAKTTSDGKFSISFSADVISWGGRYIIKATKAGKNEYTQTQYCYGSEDLGMMILNGESKEDKLNRLTEALDKDALGLQYEDTIYSVKNNLLLKTTAGEGSGLTWSSSNEEVVSTSGVIKRPIYGQDAITVFMMATVDIEGETKEKEFMVLIKAEEEDTSGEDEDASGETGDTSGSSGRKNSSDSNAIKGYTVEEGFEIGQLDKEYIKGEIENVVKVNGESLEKQLKKVEDNEVILIPVINENDTTDIQFDLQDIKNMQEKKSVLKIETSKVIYEIPTEQIDVEAISREIGTAVKLEDIKFSVKIGETKQEMAQVVKYASEKNDLSIIVQPVDFEIEASYKDKKYSVSKFNVYVSRMVRIPEGTDIKKITTAIITEKDGSIRHIPTSVTVIDGIYYAIINSLTNSTYTLIYNKESFEDVGASHWAKEDIEKMASRLIIKGNDQGLFNPDQSIKRDEVAITIVKGLGIKPEAVDIFNDVIESSEAAAYIGTAYSYGIIKGVSDYEFKPEEYVTRQDVMVMIYRASKIAGFVEKDVDIEMTDFKDYENVSEYAREAVRFNVSNKVFIGNTDGMLLPRDLITKAELATVINRFLIDAQLID